MDETLDSWFKREVLRHEAALRRYIHRVWPYREEVYDLLQETYVRAYEAGKRSRYSVTRPFLFTTARNLMADRQRHARVISIEAVSDPDALNVLIDETTPERRLGAWQDLKRVIGALNRLPDRAREIIWLRRVDKMSNKQVAEHLGISVRTVENHLFRGMRALGDAVFSNEIHSPEIDPVLQSDQETEHGSQ